MGWHYFLEINLIFSLLVFAYWGLLREGQQFQWNRMVLWAIVLLAFMIPFLPPLVLSPVDKSAVEVMEIIPAVQEPGLFSGMEAPAVAEAREELWSFSWTDGLWMIYLTGMGFFFLRYAIRLIHLLRFIALSEKERYAGKYWLIYAEKPLAPFSFFRYLVLGENGQKHTHRQVLQHERVHADQWHSLDVMLSEWVKVLFWFNPLAYLYARMVRNNLEFLVDRQILASGTDRRLYQYHLLQLSTGIRTFNLTNHYNHSFLKKRIMMMNSLKKTKWNQFKLVVFGLMILPLVQVFGQSPLKKSAEDTYVIITSDAAQSELEQLRDELFKENTQLIFEELTYGDDGKLSAMQIKVIVRDRGKLGYTFDKKLIEEKGFVPLFAIKITLPRSGAIGVGALEAEDIDELVADWKKWQVRTAGMDASPQGLKAFRKEIVEATKENLRRKANMSEEQLENISKGEGRSTYQVDEQTFREARKKIERLSKEHKLTPVFFVDGLQKKVTLDDFRPDQLDKVEVVTKYKSSRAGKEFNPQYTDLQVFLTRKLKEE